MEKSSPSIKKNRRNKERIYKKYKEELTNRFKKLSDDKLLELYANPELLEEIAKDLNHSLSDIFYSLIDYIINVRFNSGQKIIFDYLSEKNIIITYKSPKVLMAIKNNLRNNLNEKYYLIDNLNDNVFWTAIYVARLHNERKKNLREYLTTLDINTLSDMLDYKLIKEKCELREKFYVNMDFIDNSIKTEFENRTVAIRTFLSELDINDLLKFFLSHKTLQNCSDFGIFSIYDKEKINNLNEKRIADLSKEFNMPIDISKKLVALEFNSRIKNLKEILDKYEEPSDIPSNISLANDCHLNEKIVANYIKNQNEKSSNSVSFSLFSLVSTYLVVEAANSFSKFIYEQDVNQVLKFCNSLKKRVILNLPKEYSNAASYIIGICDKYKSDEPENEILRCIIEIFKITRPRPSNYNPFFEKILETFPSLKYENPNSNKINLEFTINNLLNCNDFDLIANSLDLSIGQFKNICSYIINLSENESENEILNFCIDNMDTKNLNFQDYNSFVEFFNDLFETFPNILQLENNKTEITETHESNNTEPKPKLEHDVNQQEKDK